MRARLLCTLAMVAVLVIGFIFMPAQGKPPDLPIKSDIHCQEECEVPAKSAECTVCPNCPAAAKNTLTLTTRVFAVADLVLPIPGFQGKADAPQTKTTCGLAPCPSQDLQAITFCDPAACEAKTNCCAKSKTPCEEKQVTQEKNLIDLIVNNISSQSWVVNGGKGTIEFFPLSMSLVIHQTPDVLEAVEGFLETLRKEQDTQIAVEIRVIGMGEEGAKQASKFFTDKKSQSAILSAVQLKELLTGLQKDQRTSVLCAPHLASMNGQSCTVEIGQEQAFVTGAHIKYCKGRVSVTPEKETVCTGFKLTVQPVVSADRKSVHMKVRAEDCTASCEKGADIPVKVSDKGTGKPASGDLVIGRLEPPIVSVMIVHTMEAIPDGGTCAVMMGERPCEIRKVTRVKELQEIPFLEELFQTVELTKGTEQVMMTITPRIVVSQEHEAKPAPKIVSSDKARVTRAKMPRPDMEEHEMSEAPKTKTGHAEGSAKKVTSLVRKYHQACAEGRSEEAVNLAVQALAIDPACFDKPSGRKKK